MRRFVIVAAAAVTLIGTGAAWAPARSTGGARTATAPTALTRTPILTGLNFPAAFTFLPDGRMLYGERNTGNIYLYDLKKKTTKLMFTVTKVVSNGEQGLLGLAVDPQWPKKPYVYAYATRQNNKKLQNEIGRIKVVGDKGQRFNVIWRLDTTAGTYHDGGHIAFGPDQRLYAVVGEGHDSSNAQDMTTDAGKLLRMTRMGKAPGDNPFPGSRIFTFGLRNSFGFTFDPQTGRLWETENGPECNDEINLEQAGENHAWGPSENCSGTSPQDTNQDGPNPRIMPLAWFTPTIAPTGAVFCQGCGLTGADGHLFFGAYNTGDIREVTLDANRTGIASMKVAYPDGDSVLSMQADPSGAIYFSTPDAIYRLDQA